MRSLKVGIGVLRFATYNKAMKGQRMRKKPRLKVRENLGLKVRKNPHLKMRLQRKKPPRKPPKWRPRKLPKWRPKNLKFTGMALHQTAACQMRKTPSL